LSHTKCFSITTKTNANANANVNTNTNTKTSPSIITNIRLGLSIYYNIFSKPSNFLQFPTSQETSPDDGTRAQKLS
jgi:hypothetical protein